MTLESRAQLTMFFKIVVGVALTLAFGFGTAVQSQLDDGRKADAAIQKELAQDGKQIAVLEANYAAIRETLGTINTKLDRIEGAASVRIVKVPNK